MKTVAISMLLLVTQSGVRDAFRKVVQRASLSILRSATNRNRDETVLDAEKAIDEVKIEANSPEEEAVVSLLVRYQLAVLANNSTRSLMESQLKLDALANGFDTGAPYYKAYLADRDEMRNREVACSDAIGDMVRRKLSRYVPLCDRVQLKRDDLKTKLATELTELNTVDQ
jgi:hypothetical protein